VLYFLRVLRSRRILLQIWCVTFQMMKFFGLLIGLQTFAVVSDSFWKRTGVICKTVDSIPRKIYIWSVEDNSYRDQIEPWKLIALSVRTSANSPGSDQCEAWRAGD